MNGNSSPWTEAFLSVLLCYSLFANPETTWEVRTREKVSLPRGHCRIPPLFFQQQNPVQKVQAYERAGYDTQRPWHTLLVGLLCKHSWCWEIQSKCKFWKYSFIYPNRLIWFSLMSCIPGKNTIYKTPCRSHINKKHELSWASFFPQKKCVFSAIPVTSHLQLKSRWLSRLTQLLFSSLIFYLTQLFLFLCPFYTI